MNGLNNAVYIYAAFISKCLVTGGGADGRTGGQTDEQTSGQTGGRTNGRKDEQTDERTEKLSYHRVASPRLKRWNLVKMAHRRNIAWNILKNG